MKRVLHLFRAEKFTEGFINLMLDIPEVEHVFWIFGEKYLDNNCSYLKLDNVIYYPRIDIKIRKESIDLELLKYDLIVFHGIFEASLIDFFYNHKKILKKLILYFWGGDKELPENWKIRKKKMYIVRHAVAVVTIIPQDYPEIKKIYRPKGKHFCATYNANQTFDIVDKISIMSKKKENIVNIQVGNSATITNKHFDVLKILSQYKDENIKIHVPLSYGIPEYAEGVIKYGKKIFGNKFVAIREFMSLEEYCKFMYKMDVGIFAMERQQALGNINALIQFGCKIYFSRNSLLWDYFINDLGFVVSDIEEIHRMDIKEFVFFSEKDKLYNKTRGRELFDEKKSIELWEKIFNVL